MTEGRRQGDSSCFRFNDIWHSSEECTSNLGGVNTPGGSDFISSLSNSNNDCAPIELKCIDYSTLIKVIYIYQGILSVDQFQVT